ncbi:DNA-binding NarL/FixJ family response regulator [Catenulispora sp. GAS73]|uniref:response regulator n=1 Tax=Catenulispora sp. GAS73 TaxID=3156269 RepID=UPI0035172DD1
MRVLVADDQELFRSGFVMILDAHEDITVVAEAADGQEAIDKAVELHPDLVLMDIRMPGVDGVAAAAEICRRTAAKVLVLTMYDIDAYVYDALRAGASGFLLKDVRRDDLVRAARLVMAGESLLAPTVTRRLIQDALSRGTPRPALRRHVDKLTEREVDTLQQIARGRSNAEIAAALVVSEHTVKSHVSNLLTKLGLRDRAQAVVFAYESGLVTVGSD